jgi:hypothetical protein
VNVVDDEVSESRSRAVIHRLVPSPASPFVEHDVPRDADALCRRVEDAVGLDALRVADENPRRAPVVEPKTQRWLTTGLRPCQASYGVLPSRALVGERLRRWTAIITASPQ